MGVVKIYILIGMLHLALSSARPEKVGNDVRGRADAGLLGRVGSRDVDSWRVSPQLAVGVTMFMSVLRDGQCAKLDVRPCLLPAMLKLLICQPSRPPAFEH